MAANKRTIITNLPSHESTTGWQRQINVSESERWMMGIGGGALTFYGLKRGGWGGCLLALAGSALAWYGITGHCDVYAALGINTADGEAKGQASVRHGHGIKSEQSVIVNRQPEELFRFWRNFENLPRVMDHLESVRVIDDQRSHWVAKAPAGMTVEWDAEIIAETPNELIAWRSVGDSQVPNAGSVRFEQTPDEGGTRVKVSLNYAPPVGRLGSLIAKMFGEEPEQQVAEDLRRFKQIMETGEPVTVEGQPSGRSAISGR